MEIVIQIAKELEFMKTQIDEILNSLPSYLTGEDFKDLNSQLNSEFSTLTNLEYYFDIKHSFFHQLYDEITSIDFDQKLCTKLFLGLQPFYQNITITNGYPRFTNAVLLDRDLLLRPESNKDFQNRVKYYREMLECSEDEAYNIAFSEYRRSQESDYVKISKEVIEQSVKNFVAIKYWNIVRRLSDYDCFEDGKIQHLPINMIMPFTLVREEDLSRVYEQLLTHRFISEDTDKDSFIRIFKNIGRRENDYIIWSDYQDSKDSNKNTLIYFFDLMLHRNMDTAIKNKFLCDYFLARQNNSIKELTSANLNRSRNRLNEKILQKEERLILLSTFVDR